MFTGIVIGLGKLSDVQPAGPGKKLYIEHAEIAAAAGIGDSIAVNGCCLTVVEVRGDSVAFEAGPETLQRTNLGNLDLGSPVNLEKSLNLGDEMGGHLVTGHIDGVGLLDERIDDEEWSTFWFTIPGDLGRQMASKGSVAVDGVSLTLVDVEDHRFSVALIPHTLKVTTLGP